MLSETEFRWKYILNKEELLVLKGKRKMTAKIFEAIALKAMGAGVGDSFQKKSADFADYAGSDDACDGRL